MNDYRNKPNRDCTPTDNPAAQPKPPGRLPQVRRSASHDSTHAAGSRKVSRSSAGLQMPETSDQHDNCLEKAIEKQAKGWRMRTKPRRLRPISKPGSKRLPAAAQQYTQDTYEKLLKRWQEEDRAIVELIRKLTCAVPCWRCLIECYVCPILNALHEMNSAFGATAHFPPR